MNKSPILIPKLQIPAATSKHLAVLSFHGTMGMSTLYRFEVEFATKEPLDLSALLYSRASLKFKTKQGRKTPLHGIIIECQQMDGISDYLIYSVTLAPGVYGLTHTRNTNISLDMSIPDVIKDLFSKNAIKNYSFDLIKQYPPREFVFQYNEIDWSFITRWLQMEGMFYYFTQNEHEEQLVITDNNQSLLNNKDIQTLYYQAYPDEGEEHNDTSDIIYNFKQTLSHLPQKVKVQAYNHKQSSKPYSSEASVDPKGFGERSIWAEHIESMEENQGLATRVAESLLCQANTVQIETPAALLNPGTIVQHQRFKIPALNDRFIITKSEYSGSQKRSFLSQKAFSSRAVEDFFTCQYTAIPQSRPYRDQITAEIPRIHGILPGMIDHEGTENTVQLDEEGLYKFKIPIGSYPPGKGSHWVRKMESYIGDKYALNIPIHKSMEAVIGFHFGNPDLPVLIGTVSNSTHRNVIINESQNYMGLFTFSENSFVINEEAGKQQGIQLYTPNNQTVLTLGTDNIYTSQLDAGYYMGTASSAFINIQMNYNREVAGTSTFNCRMSSSYFVGESRVTLIGMDDAITVEGDSTYTIMGNSIGTVQGNRVLTVEGNKKTAVKGFTIYSNTGGWSVYSYLGIKYHGVVGLEFISTVGGKITTSLLFNIEKTTGWKFESVSQAHIQSAISHVINTSDHLTLECSALPGLSSRITLEPTAITIQAPKLYLEGTVEWTLDGLEGTIYTPEITQFGVISEGEIVYSGASPQLLAAPVQAKLAELEQLLDSIKSSALTTTFKSAAYSIAEATANMGPIATGALGAAAASPALFTTPTGDVGVGADVGSAMGVGKMGATLGAAAADTALGGTGAPQAVAGASTTVGGQSLSEELAGTPPGPVAPPSAAPSVATGGGGSAAGGSGSAAGGSGSAAGGGGTAAGDGGSAGDSSDTNQSE